MIKSSSAICAAGLFIFAGSANAEGIFQIGPQVGYSSFDISSSVSGMDLADDNVKGATIGLITRYTMPANKNGVFFGIQAGIAKEFASDTDPISGTLYTPEFSFTGSGQLKKYVKWSMDIMPRIGYELGDISVSLAGGLSLVQGQAQVSGSGVLSGGGLRTPLNVSFEDTQWHTGWKIAPGIDYELSENMTLFSQVHYARYNSKTYSDSGLSVKVKPESPTRN